MHAPVGLEIGAVTPEEIAVAIVAEMIAERRHATPNVASKSTSTTPPAKSRTWWKRLRNSRRSTRRQVLPAITWKSIALCQGTALAVPIAARMNWALAPA